MIPLRLVQIVDFLKVQNLSLSVNSRDGRINSAFNEDEIFNLIDSNFSVNRPNMRDWVDFSFEENGQFYPVNIKVSTTHTADNLNCKLGIYYALTGDLPPFGNEVIWERYFKALSENLKQNEADYYFLIVNKNDPCDVFTTSLRGLENLVPNGNNLPFQAKWDANRKQKARNFSEAKEFILSTFAHSLKLRADAYFHFINYFDEYKNA